MLKKQIKNLRERYRKKGYSELQIDRVIEIIQNELDIRKMKKQLKGKKQNEKHKTRN